MKESISKDSPIATPKTSPDSQSEDQSYPAVKKEVVDSCTTANLGEYDVNDLMDAQGNLFNFGSPSGGVKWKKGVWKREAFIFITVTNSIKLINVLSANISPQYVNSRVSNLSIDKPRPFTDPCWFLLSSNSMSEFLLWTCHWTRCNVQTLVNQTRNWMKWMILI